MMFFFFSFTKYFYTSYVIEEYKRFYIPSLLKLVFLKSLPAHQVHMMFSLTILIFFVIISCKDPIIYSKFPEGIYYGK